MTARWPGTGLRCASSSILFRHGTPIRFLSPSRVSRIRHYAKDRAFKKPDGITSTPADPVKAALAVVEAKAKVDPINPPRSTLPPPLSLPTRGSEAAPVYWYRIGRAYGTFYKDGIKAVWFNSRASKILRERIPKERGAKNISDAVAKKSITRSEFQLLARDAHDIGKLPFFGLLILILGEWLVFVVPFIPNAVPGTCRIPKQIRGMRMTAEERRRISFRQGIIEPSKEQLEKAGLNSSAEVKDVTTEWPMATSKDYRSMVLKNLRDDQLHHLSSTLGLHSRIWDRVQLPPPSFLLRSRIGARLQYLSQDDMLLLQNGGAARLSPDELHIACEERGLDILGKKDDAVRQSLTWWLKRQEEDGASGKALFAMLFRRPNAWTSVSKDVEKKKKI